MENDTNINNQIPTPAAPESPPDISSPLKTATMIPSPVVPKPKSLLPVILIAAGIGLLLILIIGIFVGISILKSAFKYTPPPPPPPPAPVVTITPISSKYASDAGILKLRDDLKTISQSVDSVDLFEPQINTPALDLNINIK